MLQNNLDFHNEIFGDSKASKINACKEFLNQTDYVIIKMYETVVQGGSIIEMLKDYKEILIERNEARQLINELEMSEDNGD